MIALQARNAYNFDISQYTFSTRIVLIVLTCERYIICTISGVSIYDHVTQAATQHITNLFFKIS